jgi:hypothetical protein
MAGLALSHSGKFQFVLPMTEDSLPQSTMGWCSQFGVGPQQSNGIFPGQLQ